METVKKQEPTNNIKHPGDWGVKEMEADLLASGAVEITPEQMKEERFKKLMKNVKDNGKFICE